MVSIYPSIVSLDANVTWNPQNEREREREGVRERVREGVRERVRERLWEREREKGGVITEKRELDNTPCPTDPLRWCIVYRQLLYHPGWGLLRCRGTDWYIRAWCSPSTGSAWTAPRSISHSLKETQFQHHCRYHWCYVIIDVTVSLTLLYHWCYCIIDCTQFMLV